MALTHIIRHTDDGFWCHFIDTEDQSEHQPQRLSRDLQEEMLDVTKRTIVDKEKRIISELWRINNKERDGGKTIQILCTLLDVLLYHQELQSNREALSVFNSSQDAPIQSTGSPRNKDAQILAGTAHVMLALLKGHMGIEKSASLLDFKAKGQRRYFTPFDADDSLTGFFDGILHQLDILCGKYPENVTPATRWDRMFKKVVIDAHRAGLEKQQKQTEGQQTRQATRSNQRRKLS